MGRPNRGTGSSGPKRPTGTTFRRWMQTMIGNGIPIDWYEIV